MSVDEMEQCARCGSSMSAEPCEYCPGTGWYNTPDPECPVCDGAGLAWWCLSSVEYCEVVELARIARHPAHPWVLRPMLRIWRAVLAPAWPCWPVAAAVSYALPGRTGDLYRFDGWERVGAVKPSAGGGTWSTSPKVNTVADGVKTLWRYRYPACPEVRQ